jgi:hypothetical protein
VTSAWLVMSTAAGAASAGASAGAAPAGATDAYHKFNSKAKKQVGKSKGETTVKAYYGKVNYFVKHLAALDDRSVGAQRTLPTPDSPLMTARSFAWCI